MIKAGITGQAGFIGTHLFNAMGLKKDSIIRIPFEDEYFANEDLLRRFVADCDVIVHLAAMNRHNDHDVIYSTNISLVQKLIAAIEAQHLRPHILFSSSTQEERDNLYGLSKREGRMLFESWAQRNGARFTGLVIPNVFGPFGNPYYNSVVATFCHQLTHDEIPKIDTDGQMKLIYINELVEVIIGKILNPGEQQVVKFDVSHRHESKVSEILNILEGFKAEYYEKGKIPDLNSALKLALFNTFRCYMPEEKFPFPLKLNSDYRGIFVEVIRATVPGQSSYSTTGPGITRGNHFHTRKVERFAVIRGKARIRLRRVGTTEIIGYDLNGDVPSFVDMPVWHTHNITNTGEGELLTLFWINEPYDPSDPDTYFEPV